MPKAAAHSRRTNGAAIRALREALGHPHGTFAIQVGISPGYLSNVEADRKQPSPDVTVRIAQALGVPVAAITYVTVGAV